ncbi:MAG: hypothetical protein F2519_00080 [Actinobacteria bacterium]|uniref:Unannotated protein n=1 Tax=freshwater metagenome TaxID=449393 RepID=A0A6J6R8C8_9ZZZZ|nr:hypothetical protein [Actinomycetota bacterium]MTA03963.1 hypothetical protein [Actinomycetota bacterium]
MANTMNMNKLSNFYQRNSRSAFALLLIALSILSAFFIVHQSNRSDLVWATRVELPLGEVISAGVLRATHVRLPENGANYFSTKQSIIGATVIKAISPNDLIPFRSLSRTSGATSFRSVPLQVSTNDLPADLMAGESVDIYSLPLQSNISQDTFQVSQVEEDIVVESLDSKSQSLGGAIGVVLRLKEDRVITLFAQTARSRIVLVRSAR